MKVRHINRRSKSLAKSSGCPICDPRIGAQARRRSEYRSIIDETARTTEGATQTDLVGEQDYDGRVVA